MASSVWVNRNSGVSQVSTPTFVDSTDPSKRLTYSLSGMTTAIVLTVSSTQSTAQTLSLPNITSADTVAVTTLAQRLASKDLADSSTTISNVSLTSKALAFSLSGMTASVVLTVASSQATSQTLTIPTTRQAETLAIKPQTATTLSTPLNPTGTTDTTGLMMGLAVAITPQVTGNLYVTVCGQIVNGTATDGAKVEIRVGTGTAPVNGGALAGTVYGSQQQVTTIAGLGSEPFSLTALVTGLTVGTAAWIDVDLAAITGGTATISSVAVSAFEL